jgi:acid phosphatase (class A)
MKRFRRLTVAAFAAAAGMLAAAEPRPPVALDVHALLAGPPAADSPLVAHEFATVLALQESRTPADVERIKREGKLSPFLFRDVLGDWFTEENLPLTTAVLNRAGDGAFQAAEAAKKVWSRARPSLVDHRVVPCVGLPANSSYPSSHGACGVLWGTLLGRLAPDRAAELLRRGRQIGDDRVAGGVHYPSDIEAGRIIGRAWLERLAQDSAFQAQLAAAAEEFRRVRTARESPAAKPALAAAR